MVIVLERYLLLFKMVQSPWIHLFTLFLTCSGRKKFIKDIVLVELQHTFDNHSYEHHGLTWR
jgi:hypothetical protein